MDHSTSQTVVPLVSITTAQTGASRRTSAPGMRRMRLCKEQGTGIDKVLMAVEVHQVPPPDFQAEDDAMRVILLSPRRFSAMTQEERIRACYQHAGLKYVSG